MLWFVYVMPLVVARLNNKNGKHTHFRPGLDAMQDSGLTPGVLVKVTLYDIMTADLRSGILTDDFPSRTYGEYIVHLPHGRNGGMLGYVNKEDAKVGEVVGIWRRWKVRSFKAENALAGTLWTLNSFRSDLKDIMHPMLLQQIALKSHAVFDFEPGTQVY
eukprot:GEMP01072285.1.p1 GENE.GEMP01072285.1~~GEMP01072285.1.p1  ORF type:complete len:172 (+),score=20.71 GEMP01072285.1:39-518(+)